MTQSRSIASRSFVAALFVGASMLLAACGDPEIQKGDVEKSAMKTLTAAVGKESPPITCPGNLKAKVNEKLTCAIDVDGKTYDVAVTVTSVENSTANFKVEVADKPHG